MKRLRARRLVAVSVAALVAATTLGGCFPQSVGTEGRQINDLYRLFFAGGVVVAAMVWGVATWTILRYRSRRRRSDGPGEPGEAGGPEDRHDPDDPYDPDPLPPQTHGHNGLEILWTAIPLITVLGLFAATYTTLQSVNALSPNPGVRVHVDGFRWQWRFEYVDAGVSLVGQTGGNPQLVVPVGEPVQVTLTATDVIHSFYVPALLYKLDAIPGRAGTFDFTVEVPGTYGGFCAELCGVFHDRMLFSIRAVARPEFYAWLASARGQPQPILATASP
jgi:cytochrome c oxidase subunit II